MNTLLRNFWGVLFLLLSFSVAAQKEPPGTHPLKPSETGEKHAAFIDNEVVTVLGWYEFLYWTKRTYGEGSEEYKAILPDSLICSQAYGYYFYSEKYYIPVPQRYRNFPIVGITYEQVIKYCAWRSDRVNEMLKLKKKKYTVSYALPTEADLKEAYKQWKIVYCYPYDRPVSELTAEKMVMIKGWELSFESYQGAGATLGFRCVAEMHKE